MTRAKAIGSAKSSKKSRTAANWVPWLVIGLVVVIAIAAGLASLRTAVQNSITLPSVINADTAYTYYERNKVVIVDVRTAKDWSMYHITNSKSIPLADLPSRMNELPRNTAIVVVDDYFDLSPQGRDILLKAGWANVAALQDGILAWAQRGYPVIGLVPN